MARSAPDRAGQRPMSRESSQAGGSTRTLCPPYFRGRLLMQASTHSRFSELFGMLGALVFACSAATAVAQPKGKPNILFIMGDDIGWMQPSIYHRGLMVGETPNIDRIGNEGAIFM